MADPLGTPDYLSLLKRVIMAWDTHDSLDFLAAVRAGRRALGLKLADERDDREDAEVLKANGYPEGDW